MKESCRNPSFNGKDISTRKPSDTGIKDMIRRNPSFNGKDISTDKGS